MKYKKFNFLYFSLFLILFLCLFTGCSIEQNNYTVDDDWEDEVLVVSDCGFDGLKCCLDQEPSCNFGQTCCTDPNDESNNYCADECSCGKRGAFCCDGDSACESGLSCEEGKCMPCGEKDEVCCGEGGTGTCNNDLVCYYDKCVECGLPGAPCCASSSQCNESDSDDSSRLECKNKLCAYCGASGRVACPNDPVCEPGHLLNNFVCLPCGGDNQPCCSTSTDSNLICETEKGLECSLGFCSKK